MSPIVSFLDVVTRTTYTAASGKSRRHTGISYSIRHRNPHTPAGGLPSSSICASIYFCILITFKSNIKNQIYFIKIYMIHYINWSSFKDFLIYIAFIVYDNCEEACAEHIIYIILQIIKFNKVWEAWIVNFEIII